MIRTCRQLHGAFALALIGSMAAWTARAESLTVTTDRVTAVFDTTGGALSRLEACHPACNTTGAGEILRFRFDGVDGSGAPVSFVVSDDAALDRQIAAARFSATRTRTDQHETIVFESPPLEGGVVVRKTYQLARYAYDLVATVEIAGTAGGGASLQLAAGGVLTATDDASAFEGSRERPSAVYAIGDDASTFGNGVERKTITEPFWAGLRYRFWALLARPADTGSYRVTGQTNGEVARVTIQDEAPGTVHRSILYAGPVELDSLKATSGSLAAFLYSSLWFWLRWLCFAMYYPLVLLHGLTGNWGIAVMLLAILVKFTMSPLTAVADRWQREVDTLRSAMQPQLDTIRLNFRGEEEVKRIRALYREHGASLFYPLKSLLGFLIQIPVFIAAFYMLSDNFSLSGVPFLWIEDLSVPDHFMRLPFTLPFFGEYLNLLPFVMTAATLLASVVHRSETLSHELARKQRRHLIVMAVLFFLLLYTFPAGMVLYWTSNNLIEAGKGVVVRLRRGSLRRDTD